MVLNMKETGRRTSSMGRVLRHGLMVQNMMVNTYTAKNMVKVDLLGLMVALTSVNFKTIIFRVTEHIIGPMVECLLAHG